MTKLQLKALQMAKEEVDKLRNQSKELHGQLMCVKESVRRLRCENTGLYDTLLPLHSELIDIPAYISKDESIMWIDLAIEEG